MKKLDSLLAEYSNVRNGIKALQAREKRTKHF